MLVTKEELEKRNKNSSPGAMTKALKTGYKSVHDKFFYSQANAHNRKTLGDRFKFKKGKRGSTAVEEAYKLEEKIKYLNILNNLNCSNNRNNASFISYASPGFSALKTPSAGITREKADSSTTKKKMERILTSTAVKPDFRPPAPVVTLDSSFTKTDFEASKIKTPSKSPGYKNSLEASLQTNPVYSPVFLKELREKYDRKHREVDRKIAEQNIKKKFYEVDDNELDEEDSPG